MTRLFAIVATDDWGFRSWCRGALLAAGYRVATPTSAEGAEYFLASSTPPDVVLFATRERWEALLAEQIRSALRPIAVVVLERPGGALGEMADVAATVRAALDEMAGARDSRRGAGTSEGHRSR